MAEKGYRYGVFFTARNESELEGRAFLCGQKRQRTRDPPLGSCTCLARELVPIPVQNGARISCKWRITSGKRWRCSWSPFYSRRTEKYLDVVPMDHATSATTIKALRHIFSMLGLPEHIVTDNGSQFSSQEFKNWLTQNDIIHTLTAPGHPATNRLTERYIGLFKSRSLDKR